MFWIFGALAIGFSEIVLLYALRAHSVDVPLLNVLCLFE